MWARYYASLTAPINFFFISYVVFWKHHMLSTSQERRLHIQQHVNTCAAVKPIICRRLHRVTVVIELIFTNTCVITLGVLSAFWMSPLWKGWLYVHKIIVCQVTVYTYLCGTIPLYKLFFFLCLGIRYYASPSSAPERWCVKKKDKGSTMQKVIINLMYMWVKFVYIKST